MTYNGGNCHGKAVLQINSTFMDSTINNVYAEETVEMNEYLLNRSFMSAVKKQNYDKALAIMTEL